MIIPDSGPFQAGGLSQHVQDWQDITTDYVSLQAIRGVEIPIWKMPPLLPPSRKELERRTVDPVVDQNISEMLDHKGGTKGVRGVWVQGLHRAQGGEREGVWQEIHSQSESEYSDLPY